MKTIWKFALEPSCTLNMPVGSKILAVQVQYEYPQLWALVDPDAATEERHFISYGTGQKITEPVGEYVGAFQTDGGVYVFHVFEVPK